MVEETDRAGPMHDEEEGDDEEDSDAASTSTAGGSASAAGGKKKKKKNKVRMGQKQPVLWVPDTSRHSLCMAHASGCGELTSVFRCHVAIGSAEEEEAGWCS